jgi:hypothetical protein
MRSVRLATVGTLLVVFVLALVCPCPPAAAEPVASSHDCCAPAAGIRAAEAGCCVDGAIPASQAATLAAPAPALTGPVAVADASSPTVPPAFVAASHPTLAAVSPPLVLRV